MRTGHIALTVAAIAACVLCYFAGQRSATPATSPAAGEREGQIMYAMEMHRSLESTNLAKLRELLDIEILIFTHQYELQFGAPSGPGRFAADFKEAKVIADRLKGELVPESSFNDALGLSGQNTPEK